MDFREQLQYMQWRMYLFKLKCRTVFNVPSKITMSLLIIRKAQFKRNLRQVLGFLKPRPNPRYGFVRL